MLRRLPLQINGRDTGLKTLDDDVDITKLAKSAWEVLQRHQEPGIWFRLRLAMGLPVEALQKAYNALYMKSYTRGIEKILSLKVTEVDGVCFMWDRQVGSDEAYALAAEAKRIRLDKKLKLNKDRKERIKMGNEIEWSYQCINPTCNAKYVKQAKDGKCRVCGSSVREIDNNLTGKGVK